LITIEITGGLSLNKGSIEYARFKKYCGFTEL